MTSVLPSSASTVTSTVSPPGALTSMAASTPSAPSPLSRLASDAAPPTPKPRVALDAETDDDDDDMEDMFVDTSMGKEWGGPTRGGRMPEPTRFGDWERKGRATDF